MLLNIFTDSELVSRVVEFFENVKSLRIGVVDILDIALVAFVLYHVLKLVRGSKAIQLLKGIILLIIAYGIVYFLNMETSVYIFRYIFSNIFIILIVVFQQEIRQMIEHLGRSNVKSLRSIFGNYIADDRQALNNSVVEICKAVQHMSDSKTGALIVFERAMLPKEVTDTGVELDAEITHELIGNVFFPNSPLHDGAALIRDSRLYKAGCVLPNTRKDDVSSDLGTRHRAAIGMSEESDAVIVVVSEETGQISSAYKGNLTRDYNEATLRDYLLGILSDKDENSQNAKGVISKLFKKGGKK